MNKLLQFLLTPLLLFVITISPVNAIAETAAITNDEGQKLNTSQPPQRVVSLVPEATETLVALGVADRLVGVTYRDNYLADLADKPIIGGPMTPHFDLIKPLNPDLIIIPPQLYQQTKQALIKLNCSDCPLFVWDNSQSLAQAEAKLYSLGTLFQRQQQIEQLFTQNYNLFDTIRRKTANLTSAERQRVIRVELTPQGLTTPAQKPFQYEVIKAAGAIPPSFTTEQSQLIDIDRWKSFNPQVIYTCNANKMPLKTFLNQDKWREVEAVKQGRIYTFPCALTDRASVNTAYFTAWLSSMIYVDQFAQPDKLLLPNHIGEQRLLDLPLPYVSQASIIDSRLMDFTHRTLLIRFKSPQRVMSTVNGQRSGIETVGNSLSPTPVWGIYHKLGYERSLSDLYSVLGLVADKTDIMTTGADINNLAIKTATFEDLTVTALVTAGVEGNAIRAAKDIGAAHEKPGTINIIVLTNRQLTDRAAARALITITEAKTAALWDMDIRSVQSPLQNPATGTGTDNIIVVQGEGYPIDYSGGHSKLGQLMSETVYAAVQEALLKQNGKLPQRSVFERLGERGLDITTLFANCDEQNLRCLYALESLLLTPEYASFIEEAFALSDAKIMGRQIDITAFSARAKAITDKIAGQPIRQIEQRVNKQDLPEILQIALNAIGTGLHYLLADLPASKVEVQPANNP